MPDLVPLHVILTQNSAKKERIIHLTHNAADNADSVTKRTGLAKSETSQLSPPWEKRGGVGMGTYSSRKM